jgi:hypothetical protein
VIIDDKFGRASKKVNVVHLKYLLQSFPGNSDGHHGNTQ